MNSPSFRCASYFLMAAGDCFAAVTPAREMDGEPRRQRKKAVLQARMPRQLVERSAPGPRLPPSHTMIEQRSTVGFISVCESAWSSGMVSSAPARMMRLISPPAQASASRRRRGPLHRHEPLHPRIESGA